MARTPIIPPRFRRQSDGCSAVPDRHFRRCCEAHDFAYRRLGGSRREADRQLRECMIRANRIWIDQQLMSGHTLRACLAYIFRWSWRPWVWWAAVRLFGWRHFDPETDE